MDLTEELLKEWKRSGKAWEKYNRQARSIGLEAWNPAIYAIEAYRTFLGRFPPREGAILGLGLNPGPFGMAQTGIPFTDCRTARTKLGIELEIPGLAPPDLAHRLKKPDGKWRGTYERSSLGIYLFLAKAWGTLEKAYQNWYVANPCPLFFLEPGGWNITPADRRLKKLTHFTELRKKTLERFHAILKPRGIVFLGRDVAEALGEAAASLTDPGLIICYSHPARAVPADWAEGLVKELNDRELL